MAKKTKSVKKQTILITIDGGVADVIESTVPKNTEVHFIDYDNLRDSPDETFARLSPEAKRWLEINDPKFYFSL